jgi:hypothetical protein
VHLNAEALACSIPAEIAATAANSQPASNRATPATTNPWQAAVAASTSMHPAAATLPLLLRAASPGLVRASASSQR